MPLLPGCAATQEEFRSRLGTILGTLHVGTFLSPSQTQRLPPGLSCSNLTSPTISLIRIYEGVGRQMPAPSPFAIFESRDTPRPRPPRNGLERTKFGNVFGNVAPSSFSHSSPRRTGSFDAVRSLGKTANLGTFFTVAKCADDSRFLLGANSKRPQRHKSLPQTPELEPRVCVFVSVVRAAESTDARSSSIPAS